MVIKNQMLQLGTEVHTPVIPAVWEVETGELQVQVSSGQFSKTSSQDLRRCRGGVPGDIEWQSGKVFDP